jgi:hypothetical protein
MEGDRRSIGSEVDYGSVLENSSGSPISLQSQNSFGRENRQTMKFQVASRDSGNDKF